MLCPIRPSPAARLPDPATCCELRQVSLSSYYKDLLAVETIATLNAAFCDYHVKHCPPSQQLLDECQTVRATLFSALPGALQLPLSQPCAPINNKFLTCSLDGRMLFHWTCMCMHMLGCLSTV